MKLRATRKPASVHLSMACTTVGVGLSDVVLAHQKVHPGLGNFAAARHGTGVVETRVAEMPNAADWSVMMEAISA
jgi:hypothetical protein